MNTFPSCSCYRVTSMSGVVVAMIVVRTMDHRKRGWAIVNPSTRDRDGADCSSSWDGRSSLNGCQMLWEPGWQRCKVSTSKLSKPILEQPKAERSCNGGRIPGFRVEVTSWHAARCARGCVLVKDGCPKVTAM